jgi:hypothetical protein
VVIRVIFQGTARISSTGIEGHQVHDVAAEGVAVLDHVALAADPEAPGVVAVLAVAADPEAPGADPLAVGPTAVVLAVVVPAAAVPVAAPGAEANWLMQ